ncbi:MAG: DUF4123 domain-containing protein [Burkholderiaceae bacterium]|jgi:hypothetical protein|nr:DUF4123 domain-containing protein [Burkholderiaceae bacterium]
MTDRTTPSTDPMSSDEPSPIALRFGPLADSLAQGWRQFQESAAATSAQRPPRAYLLLNGWDDNPYAQALEELAPNAAQARVAVVTPQFEYREDKGPCLIELPANWDQKPPPRPTGTPASSTAKRALEAPPPRKWSDPYPPPWARREAEKTVPETSPAPPASPELTEPPAEAPQPDALNLDDLSIGLAGAWLATQQRLAAQKFCAVLFAQADAKDIAAHLVRLGRQQLPPAGPTRQFPFQDARIQQRIWPVFTPEQHLIWLGPVAQWWALKQPWGPWSQADLLQIDPTQFSAAPEWFVATPPSPEQPRAHAAQGLKPETLFTPDQWKYAGQCPTGNRVWQQYAMQDIDPQRQPDGATMDRLISDGLRLGLSGANLQDYVWCSWQAGEAGLPRELDWREPRLAQLLQDILRQLREEPEASFADLFVEQLPMAR